MYTIFEGHNLKKIKWRAKKFRRIVINKNHGVYKKTQKKTRNGRLIYENTTETVIFLREDSTTDSESNFLIHHLIFVLCTIVQ